MSDAGTAGFTDEEVVRLREYLLKGGFIWADDFWGDAALEHFTERDGEDSAAERIPGARHPARRTPIFRTMFQISKLPQIPSIRIWRPYRVTSERGAETDDRALPRHRGQARAT